MAGMEGGRDRVNRGGRRSLLTSSARKRKEKGKFRMSTSHLLQSSKGLRFKLSDNYHYNHHLHAGSLVDTSHWEEPVNLEPNKCEVTGYVSLLQLDFAELKTYDEARQTCAADGGLLAMPRDNVTNTFIHNLGGGAGIRWIGLTDLGNEGQFVYEDGQNLASSGYSNWHPGEPNDAHKGEHCVMMFNSMHGWNDAICSLARGFIC
ncbi:PREDICTED: collectin-10-like [Branchiostoma belcheri]|uniref:Collectin-10-like n=1 Tax=Branchiostoma belcheri TaxID=7741 RepID=A0A6P4Y5J5_BRABE|nr:PREDICTED: collectin-10-like [Branchiostoma belcheri]